MLARVREKCQDIFPLPRASFYAAACRWKERVAGGGSGAPPSAMSEGGGSGAPPSATSVGGGSGAPPSATSSGGGSGAPPSAMSVGGGSGAPPSARIGAFSEQFPEVADPQAEPNTSTNPRQTSRIFPKCIVSSSEVHGVRKNLTPSAKHAWRLRPASVFTLERRKSARLSNQQVRLHRIARCRD